MLTHRNASKQLEFLTMFNDLAIGDLELSWQVVLVLSSLTIFLLSWLCYTIKKGHLSCEEIIQSQNQGTISDPLTTSPLLSPLQLFVVRFVIILWLIAVDIELRMISGLKQSEFPVYAYYTVWIWMLIFVYFCISAVLTLSNYLMTNVSGNKCFCCFRAVTFILFHVDCGCALLVSLVFWCLLFPLADPETRNNKMLRFNVFATHITNSIAIYADLMINNISFTTYHHAIFCGIPPFLYVVFAWTLNIYYDVPFGYPFVDPANPWNAVSSVVIFIMHIMCWLFAYKVKGYVVEKCIRKRHMAEHRAEETKTSSVNMRRLSYIKSD